MAFAVDDSAAAEMLVSAGLTYEVIAASCSSPQTTHINAGKRADTLMLWVHIGMAQAVLFGGIAVWIQVKRGKAWWPIVLGIGLGMALLYAQYVYAKNAGLDEAAQGAPPTESYGQ